MRAASALSFGLVMVFLLSTLAIARPSSAIFVSTTTATTTTNGDVCTIATSAGEIDIACTIQEGTDFTLPVNLPNTFFGDFPVIDLCESSSPCPLEYTDASQISDVLGTIQTGPSMHLSFFSDIDTETSSTWTPQETTAPNFPVADINALDLVALPEGPTGTASFGPTCHTADNIDFCLTLTLVSDSVEQPPTTTVPEFPIAASMIALVAITLVALSYLRRQSGMNIHLSS
jgi:hypothetical protein